MFNFQPAIKKLSPKAVPKPTSITNLLKKNKYEQRIIDVFYATFCLLVSACTGGAVPSASKALVVGLLILLRELLLEKGGC